MIKYIITVSSQDGPRYLGHNSQLENDPYLAVEYYDFATAYSVASEWFESDADWDPKVVKHPDTAWMMSIAIFIIGFFILFISSFIYLLSTI